MEELCGDLGTGEASALSSFQRWGNLLTNFLVLITSIYSRICRHLILFDVLRICSPTEPPSSP